MIKEAMWLMSRGSMAQPFSSSEPGFNPHWHPYQSLVASGMASSQNCFCMPEKSNFACGHVITFIMTECTMVKTTKWCTLDKDSLYMCTRISSVVNLKQTPCTIMHLLIQELGHAQLPTCKIWFFYSIGASLIRCPAWGHQRHIRVTGDIRTGYGLVDMDW